MLATKKHTAVLKKLKKQVTTLKRKEKAARNKLRAALLKVKKMARVHQRKLTQHKKEIGQKILSTEAAVYAKLVNSIKKRSKKPKKSVSRKEIKASKMHEKKSIKK